MTSIQNDGHLQMISVAANRVMICCLSVLQHLYYWYNDRDYFTKDNYQ